MQGSVGTVLPPPHSSVAVPAKETNPLSVRHHDSGNGIGKCGTDTTAGASLDGSLAP